MTLPRQHHTTQGKNSYPGLLAQLQALTADLLDHACIPQGLAIFKALGRHYWEIAPQATAFYINAYREMWDSDDQEPNRS